MKRIYLFISVLIAASIMCMTKFSLAGNYKSLGEYKLARQEYPDQIRLSMMAPVKKGEEEDSSISDEENNGSAFGVSDNNGDIFLNYKLTTLGKIMSSIFKDISQCEKRKTQVGVSNDQINTLNILKTDYKKKQIQNDAEFKILQLDARELLRKDIELDEFESWIREMIKLNKRICEQSVDFYKKYYSIVNKEQRAKLKELIKK